MFARIAQSLLGSANDRFMKRLAQEVEKINALEPEVEALSDEALKARTDWLRERIAGGESLDDVMNDAFATVREAACSSPTTSVLPTVEEDDDGDPPELALEPAPSSCGSDDGTSSTQSTSVPALDDARLRLGAHRGPVTPKVLAALRDGSAHP